MLSSAEEISLACQIFAGMGTKHLREQFGLEEYMWYVEKWQTKPRDVVGNENKLFKLSGAASSKPEPQEKETTRKDVVWRRKGSAPSTPKKTLRVRSTPKVGRQTNTVSPRWSLVLPVTHSFAGPKAWLLPKKIF